MVRVREEIRLQMSGVEAPSGQGEETQESRRAGFRVFSTQSGGMYRRQECKVNELISNCFKHAFPQEKKGEIRIGLKADDDGPWGI